MNRRHFSNDQAIAHSILEFFNADPSKLLDMLEVLVTMKSNPIVHRISFSSIAQGDGEPVSDYLIRLKSGARDCNFICPNCDHDLSGIYVKDQFIRGIANDALQADLLAKAGSLETLEQNVSHAQAFEMALRDQNKMSGISDIARLQMSAYRRQKRAQNTIRPTATNNRRRNMMEIQSQRNACRGCGSFQHGKTGSGDRPRMCPTWGQTCRACGKENHFEGVCQSKGRVKQGAVWSPEDKEAVMDAAHSKPRLSEVDLSEKQKTKTNSNYPRTPPFSPTSENVPKLKEWLLERFATTVFNSSGKFPAMSGPPAHIHLKEGSTPKTRHNPIPVPYHYKEQVKEALWEDVKRGIISPVPIGTPTDWCSTMVITAKKKKNGKPRRTVDYQHLNSQCKRETHHTSSPFQLSLQVPPNTKKTVLDAVDGYHSIPLDEESQPLTTFITEWGRFMYLR